MSKWKIISKNSNWFIGCSAQMIFKKTEKKIFARSCQNKFEKNANSSYLNVWTSVRFLKAPIYSKGWWKIVGETLNNNALSSQWINQYTLFFKMPLTTKCLPLILSGGDLLCYIGVTQFFVHCSTASTSFCSDLFHKMDADPNATSVAIIWNEK